MTEGSGLDDSTLYEIEAKIPDDRYTAMQAMSAAQRMRETELMLQSLLAERFQLKVHFAKADMPCYDLVIDKDGSRLPDPNDESANSAPTSASWVLAPNGEFRFRNVHLEEILQAPIFGLGDRPIVNKTGLSGAYNLRLRWKSPQNTVSTSQPAVGGDTSQTQEEDVSIFTAIREQLGLRLVPSHTEFDIVNVDHIEPPSEN